jgi:hypothetical protein
MGPACVGVRGLLCIPHNTQPTFRCVKLYTLAILPTPAHANGMSLTSTSARRVPPEMVVEIAFGLEAPTEVAARFGFSASDYQELSTQTWFRKQLEEKRAELAAQGWTFRSKMGVLAEDLLTDAYVAAKVSESATVKLEVAKYLTKVADLEPKDKFQSTAGGGFMININLGNTDSTSRVIDIAPKDVSAALPDSLDELPPLPEYLLNFPCGNELLGAELA